MSVNFTSQWAGTEFAENFFDLVFVMTRAGHKLLFVLIDIGKAFQLRLWHLVLSVAQLGLAPGLLCVVVSLGWSLLVCLDFVYSSVFRVWVLSPDLGSSELPHMRHRWIELVTGGLASSPSGSLDELACLITLNVLRCAGLNLIKLGLNLICCRCWLRPPFVLMDDARSESDFGSF